MQKRAFLMFALLALIACFLSYKLGSSPVAFAKSHAPQQDSTVALPLPASPGTWTLNSFPAEGGRAIATKAAGGSGVQHVATCVSATVENANGSLGELTLQLLDGTSILQQWQIVVPYQTNASGPGNFIFSQCDLNIVGSVNTSMTLQFSANATNEYENVNLVGYDAQ